MRSYHSHYSSSHLRRGKLAENDLPKMWKASTECNRLYFRPYLQGLLRLGYDLPPILDDNRGDVPYYLRFPSPNVMGSGAKVCDSVDSSGYGDGNSGYSMSKDSPNSNNMDYSNHNSNHNSNHSCNDMDCSNNRMDHSSHSTIHTTV